MTPKEAKKRLRVAVTQVKRSLSPDQKEAGSMSALSRLEQLPLFLAAEKVLLYHALPDELQTAPLLEKWEKSKQLFLPVVQGENLLIKHYRRGETTIGRFGITEPAGEATLPPHEIELAIITGVAYGFNGARLGRGKGFYDRLLEQLSCPCIGICFEQQLYPEIPVEPHDRPMDLIVTPERVVYCKP